MRKLETVGIVLLLAITLTASGCELLFWDLDSNSGPTPTPEPYVEVMTKELTCVYGEIDGDYYYSNKLEGEVWNLGDADAHDVSIQVTFYDCDGWLLGSGNYYIGNLEIGEIAYYQVSLTADDCACDAATELWY